MAGRISHTVQTWGSFRLCGYNNGSKLGSNLGTENCLPIDGIDRSSLVEKKMDEYEEIQDLIQRRADRIAKGLARGQASENLFDVLSFCLREIIRNSFEHGNTDKVFYCAKYWPKSNKVEVVVGDYGIGVRRGLATNPNFRFATDKDALEFALLPSVSGKTHLPRRSEIWFNSGYGLYMTNRLARNGGNFVIAGGESAVHLSRKTKSNYGLSFSGTILRLNLDVEEIGTGQERLSEFKVEGAKLAAEIKGSGNRPPSAMSMLLRKDFTR